MEGHILCVLFFLLFVSACTEQSSSNSSSANRLSTGINITAAGQWSDPAIIATEVMPSPDDFIDVADLSMTASGESFITWSTTHLDPITDIRASLIKRSNPENNWQTEGPFVNNTEIRSTNPRLYTHKSSEIAYATWLQFDASTQPGQYMISRYTPNDGWTAALRLGETFNTQQVIMDALGHAIILWQSPADDATVEIHARSFDENGLSRMSSLVRGTPQQPITPGPAMIPMLTGLIDSQGIKHIFWYEKQNSSDPAKRQYDFSLWHNTYDPTTRWSTPTMIEQGFYQSRRYAPFYKLQAINDPASGDIQLTVITNLELNGMAHVFSLRHSNGQWSELETVTPNLSSYLIGYDMAVNDKGQAILVWSEASQTDPLALQVGARFFNFQDGWQAQQIIANQPPEDNFDLLNLYVSANDLPKTDINTQGIASVLWTNIYSATHDIYSSTFTPNTPWSAAERLTSLASQTPQSPMSPQIRISNQNVATVFWIEQVIGSQDMSLHLMVRDHVINPDTPLTNLPLTTTYNKPNETAALLGQLADRAIINRFNPQNVFAKPIDLQQPSIQSGPYLRDAWDPPQRIAIIPIPSTGDVAFSGPNLIVDDNDKTFANWGLLTSLTPIQQELTLLHRAARNADWQDSSPSAAKDLPNTIFAGIQYHKPSGAAYALWFQDCTNTCANIYVSRFDPINDWQPPEIVAQNVGFSRLFIDKQGNASLLSPEVRKRSLSPIKRLIVRRFLQSGGWQDPILLDIPAPLSTSQTQVSQYQKQPMFWATVDDNGGVFAVWPDNLPPANLPITRSAAYFDPVTGWGPIMPVPFPPSHPRTWLYTDVHFDPINKSMLIIGNVTQMDTDFNNIQSLASISFADNSWSSIDYLDDQVMSFFNATLTQAFASASNSSGHVHLLTFQNTDTLTSPATQIRPYHYTPQQGWQKLEPLADAILNGSKTAPNQPIMNPLDHLKVSVNDANQASASWVDNASIQRALYVSHFQPDSGWGMQEQVTTVNGWQNYITGTDIALDNTGQAHVIWDQVSHTGNADERHIYTTTHHKEGSVTPPEIISPSNPILFSMPTVSQQWSTPKIIWQSQNTPPSSTHFNYVAEPSLSINETGKLFLSIHEHANFNPVTQTIDDHNHQVFSLTENNDWQNLPLLDSMHTATSALQTASDPTTQQTVAVWLNANQALLINTQDSNGDWLEPVIIDQPVAWFSMMSDRTLAWQKPTDSQTLMFSQWVISSNATLTLNPLPPVTQSNAQLATKPIINAQASIAALWITNSQHNQPDHAIISHYQANNAWSTSEPLAIIDNNSTSNALLAATNDGAFMVIAQTQTNRHLYATRYTITDGWNSWENIDANQNLADVVMGKLRLASQQDNIMLLWVEETQTEDGLLTHRIYTNQYQNTATADGRYWQQPQQVADIQHHSFNETPSLSLADNGTAISLWAETNRPILYANIFTPEQGWQPEPKVIFSKFDPQNQTRLALPSAIILANGNMQVVWKNNTKINNTYTTQIITASRAKE